MSCSEWEERIALHAGGDLSPVDAEAVERHVAECATCQELLSGLRQSEELLRGAHAEPVDSAHYAAVRARVMSELAGERRPWWRQAWVYGLVAAAVLLAVSLRPRQPQTVAVMKPAPVTPVLPAPPAAHEAVRQAAAPVHRRPRRKPAVKTVETVTAPAEPLVVKLITDDPDVVIYWITGSETKGE
jgi:hypothetical protein